MTASLPAERGRGKRGPWELQADTLRAVQVSSSPGPAEKRRLICCPCVPREGGCRRKEDGGWEGEAEGERGGKGCLAVFKTDCLISLSSRVPLPMGVKVLLSPLVPSSPLTSPFLPLQVFGPGDNGESWHHDRKMFQFSFHQAFTSLFCVLIVCVRVCMRVWFPVCLCHLQCLMTPSVTFMYFFSPNLFDLLHMRRYVQTHHIFDAISVTFKDPNWRKMYFYVIYVPENYQRTKKKNVQLVSELELYYFVLGIASPFRKHNVCTKTNLLT